MAVIGTVPGRNERCYCAEAFPDHGFTVEHILPQARGGRTDFMNTVSACRPCNAWESCRKAGRSAHAVGYLRVQIRFEDFLLASRNIRADVHEWLASKLARNRD
ncbi:HNH endonuclease [Aquincola tertiaricarbonis]|uniref:HNH endonuclease n=1 Tax=Aquincola tertiaricarbonis TaxID=391953 RepID=UPI000697A945|nr:HNH endonuclease [Aquincola tertiaricarbonis]